MCSVVKTGRSAVVKTGEIAVISNLVPNIQLADIAASTLCRALNGHLQPSGWEPAAQLLIRKKEAPFMQIGKAAGKGRGVERHAATVWRKLDFWE